MDYFLWIKRAVLKIQSQKSHFVLFKVLLIFGLMTIYGRLLSSGHLLKFDDPIVVMPMENIDSIQGYVEKWQGGTILDLQPIRDLSFWVDFRLSELVEGRWSVFHLTNVVIWLAIVLIFHHLLIALSVNTQTASFISLFYAFNPIYVNSVGWISARKHLLSCFCILLATFLLVQITLVKNKKIKTNKILLILLLYFSSCFSQPINLLWPLFAVFYIKIKKSDLLKLKEIRISVFLWFLIAFLCAYLNQKYYSSEYLIQSLLSKYVEPENDTLGFKILAVGRYFFQCIFPIWPSIWDHYPGSFQNLFGIVLFLGYILCLYIYRILNSFLWLFFFIIALTPVLLRLTNVFASDNYLLVPGSVLLISLFYMDKQLKLTSILPKSIRIPMGCILIGILVISAKSQATLWESDFALWEGAYCIEATPKNTKEYAKQLFNHQQYKESFELAKRLLSWKPEDKELSLLYCKSLSSYSEEMSSREPDQKSKMEMIINTFSKYKIDTPWCSYYLATAFAGAGAFTDAYQEMQKYEKHEARWILEFGPDLEVITAEVILFCEKSGHSNHCRERVDQIKSYLSPGRPWRDGPFQQRLTELNLR